MDFNIFEYEKLKLKFFLLQQLKIDATFLVPEAPLKNEIQSEIFFGHRCIFLVLRNLKVRTNLYGLSFFKLREFWHFLIFYFTKV